MLAEIDPVSHDEHTVQCHEQEHQGVTLHTRPEIRDLTLRNSAEMNRRVTRNK